MPEFQPASVRPVGCRPVPRCPPRRRFFRATSRTPGRTRPRLAEPGPHARRQPLPPRFSGLRRGSRCGPRSGSRSGCRDHRQHLDPRRAVSPAPRAGRSLPPGLLLGRHPSAQRRRRTRRDRGRPGPARRRSQSRGHRRSGASTTTTTTRPATRSARSFLRHIAAARETQLPLVIHAREADDDIGDDPEGEERAGRLPAILHCFSSGRDLAQRGVDLGALRLVLGNPDLPALRRTPRYCAKYPARPASGRDRCALSRPGSPSRTRRNEPAYVAETAKILAEVKRLSAEALAKATTDNFYRIFTKIERPS